jgi:hypothetical protein
MMYDKPAGNASFERLKAFSIKMVYRAWHSIPLGCTSLKQKSAKVITHTLPPSPLLLASKV